MESEQTENDVTTISTMSNISRRRRRAASTDGDTSAFIIPDITIHRSHSLPADLGSACIKHTADRCTVCAPAGKNVPIPTPIPVTEREDLEDTTIATIRPSQPPSMALATVIKNLEDEIRHLKIERERFNRAYNQHDPALGKRQRLKVKAKIDELTAEVEKRSDQIYALYDVLEGLKEQAKKSGEEQKEMNKEELDETLSSVGIDPAELSGRVGRKAPPVGIDDIDEMSDGDELPWEGLSDAESDAELPVPGPL